MLFKSNDIATFKQYINVSFTFDINNHFPGLMEAEDDYLLPILGQTLFDELKTQAAAAEVADEYKEIISLCRKVVAPLSVLLGISTRHIKIGDSGLKKTTAEGVDNVFSWEYREIKEELTEKAAKAIDRLWQYLFAHATALNWEDPSPIKTIFKSGTDFNNHYSLHQPHRIFPLLKPIIKKVEELFIWDAIGEDFYNELKVLESDGEEETKCIDLLKSAIAHFTIYKAVNELSVKKTEHGLTVLLNKTVDQPYEGEVSAPTNLMTLTRDEALRDGNKYLKKLRLFLRAKASENLFKTYYDSSFYAKKPTEKFDGNATRKGIVRL